jgi:hypothetical protein
MLGIKHVCQTRFRHIFNFYVFATNSFEIFQNQIILFALILKVITSICNESIFHLIVKSTFAKLCGVGIVYWIFLLTEMKCHDSWRNVILSSSMINKMLDRWHRKFNCWQLWYFKAVTSYRVKRFQVPTGLTTVTRLSVFSGFIIYKY